MEYLLDGIDVGVTQNAESHTKYVGNFNFTVSTMIANNGVPN